MAKNNLIDLFLELANPNIETGESRWVDTSEFVGKYKGLVLGNGWSWGRKSSRLQRKYKVEALLSGENSPKQLLLINNQLVTKLIKFFD